MPTVNSTTTTLDQLYVPDVWSGSMLEPWTKVSRFLNSGIMVNDGSLDTFAAGPNNFVNIPFWKPLDTDSEPDYINDNPADKSVSSRIIAGKQIGMVARMHKSWSSMVYSRYMTGDDPVTAISGMTSAWWDDQYQKRIVSMCNGLLASNISVDGSDMLYSIDTSGTVTDANLIGKTSVNGAELTLGDAMGSVTAMAVHSVVYGRLKELDMIEFVQPSSESGLIATTPQGNPMFQGKTIIVDDSLPVGTNGSNLTYTSILFGNGALGLGQALGETPTELTRDSTAGNGGGQWFLHERKNALIHPFGFSFDSASIAGEAATLTELATAAKWTRVVDRKAVPLAFLRTNG